MPLLGLPDERQPQHGPPDLHLDVLRIGRAQRKLVAAQAQLQRVPQRRALAQHNGGAGRQSHLQQPAAQRAAARDGDDGGRPAGFQRGQGDAVGDFFVHRDDRSQLPLCGSSLSYGFFGKSPPRRTFFGRLTARTAHGGGRILQHRFLCGKCRKETDIAHIAQPIVRTKPGQRAQKRTPDANVETFECNIS